MPQPGFGHLIYAVTVLARLARLSLLAKAQPNGVNPVSSGVSADNTQAETMSLDAEASDSDVVHARELIAARFGAAREEISAAHGKVWENDLLDLVARTLRVKKTRIEKWSKILMATVDRGGDERFPPRTDWAAHCSVEGPERNVEVGENTGEWLLEQLDMSLLDQESWLWPGDPMDCLYENQGNLLDEIFGTDDIPLLDPSIENQ